MTVLYDNALLFADGKSRHVFQHAVATTVAEFGHSKYSIAERQQADHRATANSPVCVDCRKQTLRTRKTSRRLAATHNAGRRPHRS